MQTRDFASRLSFRKKQEVRGNARIGLEYRIRKAHNRVDIALLQKLLADSLLNAVARKRAVGKHNRRPATVTQIPHHQKKEQVGALGRPELRRIIRLHAVRHARTERRVCKDNIYAVFCADARVLAVQAVAVHHIRHFNIMQNQIGNAEH